MYDLISVGDIKLDTFVLLDNASVSCQLRMPECQLCLDYGSKIDVEVVDSQIAGTAPNVAVGIARMGKNTAVISNMGIDGTRDMAIKKLIEEGVSPAFIRSHKNEKSAYSVVMNFKGEKTILTAHNKQEYELPTTMPKTDWIYVGEMGPGYEDFFLQLAAHKKKNKTLKIGINPGSIQVDESKKELYKLLKVTDVLFVNLQEAQVIAKQKSAEVHKLATTLWKLGSKIVVITDGKNGAHSFDGKTLLYSEIFPGKLKEATGAGDSFATGYIGALMDKGGMSEGLRWGCVNSASVIEHVGPQKGLLSDKQIKDRLKKHPKFQPKEI